MQVPDVHLNGTSKDGLTAPLIAAYDALQLTFDIMKKAAPNQRDYYTLGPVAWDNAVREHDARLKRIDDTMNEIDVLIGRIEAQN